MATQDPTQLEDWLQISVSEDKMYAYLIFRPVEGEVKLTAVELETYLATQGIKYGMQQDLLYLISQSPQDFFFSENIVAVGKPARNGQDGSIRVLYELHEVKPIHPAEREDGTVDYKELNQLANVKTGQIIAERIPPVPGEPGTAVTGELVTAKDGKEALFKIGKNVVINPENTAMYATIDGLLTKTEKEKLNVFPVYEWNGDVDYNVGNIDFVGTVVIRGNILTGFRVKASGDILVTGGIEGAEVESDGSIEIYGGIIGSNKGFVKAGRNIKCSFIQEGNACAGEDITVNQSIMHSKVRAGRNVICSGVKGVVVGGLVQAGEKVVASMIGNSMSTATAIEVGVRPELRQELLHLRNQIRQLTESMDKTNKALNLIDQLAAVGPLSPDKLALRTKLSTSKRQSVDEMNIRKERVLEVEMTLEDATTARVDAVHTIFGGTKVVIGRYTRIVKDSVQHVSFRMMDGDVGMAPL